MLQPHDEHQHILQFSSARHGEAAANFARYHQH
jgi:hypothetical protein